MSKLERLTEDIIQIQRIDKHVIFLDCGCQLYYNLESGNKVLSLQCPTHRPNEGAVKVLVSNLSQDRFASIS